MAKPIMIQGTMSNAGKSFLVAGLCRIFRQDGYRVAPFKAQNLGLNSYITSDGLEMGRAQVMQAEAAGIEPDVKMNPVLIKSATHNSSQIIVNGEIFTTSGKTSEEIKGEITAEVSAAYDNLEKDYDIIVIEGAGSPVEMNIKERDIVNMAMAELADAPVLLAGDIERGGVFAQLVGTMELFNKEEKERVKGFVINKFRGNPENFESGKKFLEERTGVPVTGVIPYADIRLDDEDSLATPDVVNKSEEIVDIAVIKAPYTANTTDFTALEIIDGVSVRFIDKAGEIGKPDMILLLGSKNTMADLKWMRKSGVEEEVKKHAASGGTVFGICGGYQMLGMTISDLRDTEQGGEMKGMELLPVDTVYETRKIRTRVKGHFLNVTGDLADLSKEPLEGYETHMGISTLRKGAYPFTKIKDNVTGEEKEEGAVNGNVYGTYVHGIFDEEGVGCKIVSMLAAKKGAELSETEAMSYAAFKEEQYDKLADTVRNNLDMKKVYELLGIKK